MILAALVAAAGFAAMDCGAEKPDSRAPSTPLRYRFKEVASFKAKSPVRLYVADVDADGNDDVLVSEKGRFLWYRIQGDRPVIAQEAAIGTSEMVRGIGDANGDGRIEFFVARKTRAGIMISCRSWFSPPGPSTPLCEMGPVVGAKEGLRTLSKVSVTGCSVADKGAHPLTFVVTDPNDFAEHPRFLRAYDGVTGKELWRFAFAPAWSDVVCDRFDSRGLRVLLATYGNRLGGSWNGTTDSLACVFCLDGRSGKLLWELPIGGLAARCRIAVADIDRDGRKEILVGRYLAAGDPLLSGSRGRAPWIVAALNAEGRTLYSAALPFRATSIRAQDLDGDAVPEVIVSGTGGMLCILEHDLTLRSIFPLPPPVDYPLPSVGILGIERKGAEGEPLIITESNHTVLAREPDGDLVARSHFEAMGGAERMVTYDGTAHVLYVSDKSIHIVDLERTPFLARLRAGSKRLTVAALGLAAVAVWGVFHGRRMLRRRRERGLIQYEVQEELLMAMKAYFHGGSSLKVLDRLRLLLKNWDRMRTDGVSKEELFGKVRGTYEATLMPELLRLEMLSRKARVAPEVWDTMLSRAKLAETETQAVLTAGRTDASGRDAHIAKALAALDAVDASLAGIRAHLRSVFRTGVSGALARLVDQSREEHSAKGVTISFAPDPTDGQVFMSPVSFDKIFEALLANSIRATEKTASPAISVAILWEGNYSRIDVRDNGCGIPRDDWERIFDRRYSTREEGGGFGLYHAAEELAKFNGRIFVLESGVGAGTTMRVILRRSEKAEET